MKITILAVGRMRPGPELELVRRYLDRFDRLGCSLGLGPLNIVEILPNGRQRPSNSLKLLSNTVCLLDEGGQKLSSEEFAQELAKWRDSGLSSVTFAIGGAEGKSQLPAFEPFYTLSFGAMVFPHLLIRAMLVEQLYRATSILSGSPYHKE